MARKRAVRPISNRLNTDERKTRDRDRAVYEQQSTREPYGRGSDESDPLARKWSDANKPRKSAYPRNIPHQRKPAATTDTKPRTSEARSRKAQ
jgi:hypothetical protein